MLECYSRTPGHINYYLMPKTWEVVHHLCGHMSINDNPNANPNPKIWP